MATKADERKRKGVQVSCTLSPQMHQALEDYRWTARLTMTDLVRTAIEDYARAHGIVVDDSEDTEENQSDA